MDAFSYLSVLLSIILGLGLAQILTALGRLIRQRRKVSSYGPAWLWAFNLLLIHVQMWWSMFGLRDRAEWTFIAFGTVLLQTAVLYMAAAVILPADHDDSFDLRAHYQQHSVWLFGFLFALVGVSLAKELVFEGALPDALNLGFHAFFMLACALAAIFSNARLHAVIAYTSTLSMLGYITLLFSRLA